MTSTGGWKVIKRVLYLDGSKEIKQSTRAGDRSRRSGPKGREVGPMTIGSAQHPTNAHDVCWAEGNERLTFGSFNSKLEREKGETAVRDDRSIVFQKSQRRSFADCEPVIEKECDQSSRPQPNFGVQFSLVQSSNRFHDRVVHSRPRFGCVLLRMYNQVLLVLGFWGSR